ncbi:MAG: lacto-N-biose phosphorylase central domain-containing protein, partial [Candidatus Hydrothermarchaeota archaeon]
MRALMLLTLIVIASVGLCQQTLRIAVYQGDDKFSRSYEIGRYLDFYEIPYSKIGPIDEVSISPYDLIIIDDRSLSNTEVKKLKEFVKNGGVLIAIGAPSSLDANGNPRNGLALDILGLKGSALQNSITTREVVITKKDLITEGVYGDSFQVYSPTYNLYPANANLSEVASFRFYTYPAIATNRYGKGLVIWYQFNPFYQYLVTHRQEMNLLALNSLRKASNFKEKPLAYLGLWPDGAKSAVLVRVDFNGEEVKDEFLKINRLLAKNRKKATLFIPFYTIMDGDIKNDLMLWQNIGYEISCYGLTQDPWKDVPFSWKERRYGKRSFFSWVTSYRMPSKYPMGPFYLVYEQEFWKDLGLALHSLYSVGVSPKGCVIPYSGSIGT